MMSVSIIHAPRDEAFGNKIAAALESAGHAARRISPDPDLGDLDTEPDGPEDGADGAAIVLWSKAAAKLARLQQQAGEAMARGTLIPVAVGGARPPGGFEDLPPVDLSGWTGAPDDPRWRFVLEELQLAQQRMRLKDGDVWAAANEPEPEEEETAVFVESAEPAEAEIVETPPAFLARPQRSALTRRFSAQEVAVGATAGLVVMTVITAILAPMILPRLDSPVSPSAPVATASAPEAASEPSLTEPTNLAALRAPDMEAPLATEELEKSSATGPDAIAALIEGEAGNAGERLAPPLADSEQMVLAAVDPAGDEMAEGAVEDAAPSDAAAETNEDGANPDSDALRELIASLDVETESTIAPELEDVATAAPALQANAGDYFRDCADCPDMAALPAGSFFMGAAPGEIASDASEGPVRSVTIRAFAIGAREVTFDDWDKCVAAGACRAVSDNGWGRGARPVIGVSFDDIRAYTAWLSDKTGRAYRLPSEAEWEYAARAGSTGPFAFGPTISVDQANFNGEYPYDGNKGIFRKQTMPAASFPPNAFGLYDMHGNVWEWTADCWNASHGAALSDGSPAVTGDCTKFVLKGGAWNTGAWRLRSAHRTAKPETAREFDNGFRLARDLP